MSVPDRPDNPGQPDDDDEESTPMTTTDAATTPDQPLHDPLPYGTGFATPQQFGYGVAPEPIPAASTAVATRERSGSPVLAIAGLLSMGVAVWAILGAPVVTTTIMVAAGLVVAVLVGLVMIVRR